MNMLTHKTIRNILLILSVVLCGCEKDWFRGKSMCLGIYFL